MTIWNMEWLKLSIWIGTYGFLKEFRPEDPYITQYLTHDPMNFKDEEVYQDIFPVATYVSLSLLIVVFLLTDWLRYKPVIIMHAFSGIMMQVLLIWFRKKWQMYIMEFWYGMMTACEIAYYTYIYAKVDKKHYQIVTSHMRGASLAGRFLSGVTSQIMLHWNIMTISDLNYLTLGGISFGFLWALTLPPVKSSIYFHRSNSVVDFNDCTKAETGHAEITCANELEQEQAPVLKKMCSKSNVFGRLWADFKHAYTNLYVLKWSIWWAIATCGYNQVMTYNQLLWEDVVHNNPKDNTTQYNGLTEAVYTLFSAFAAFCFGYVKVDWKIYGEIVLGVCTFLEGVLILWSSHTNIILHAYIAYILFGILYHIMMTVSNSEVAKYIRSDSYALIFGINTFVAILLQTILTMVVTDKNSLFTLNTRQQYVVFAYYFVALGVIFTVKAAVTKIWRSLHYTL
ncbi:thiamine transporter 1-like isoform X2 [Planococcus citri]|uniref:thiamine transporter 1-like isoform X2 n=1 Tax=Planococcus citri TaxID=170843 RepID=UPI0031F9F63B